MHPDSLSQGSGISHASFCFLISSLFSTSNAHGYQYLTLSVLIRACSVFLNWKAGCLSVLRPACPAPPEGQAFPHLLSGRRTTCSFSPSKPNSPGTPILFLPWLHPRMLLGSYLSLVSLTYRTCASVLPSLSH